MGGRWPPSAGRRLSPRQPIRMAPLRLRPWAGPLERIEATRRMMPFGHARGVSALPIRHARDRQASAGPFGHPNWVPGVEAARDEQRAPSDGNTGGSPARSSPNQASLGARRPEAPAREQAKARTPAIQRARAG